jgi:hypothetical protein
MFIVVKDIDGIPNEKKTVKKEQIKIRNILEIRMINLEYKNWELSTKTIDRIPFRII